MKFEYQGLAQLDQAAKKIIAYAGDHMIWLFEGEMGAGKTTLIRAIAAALGVEDNVTSPTFSLVNEYKTMDGKSIFHFDFYRIEEEDEAYQIGTEEYFSSKCLCFVEWSAKIPSLLPDKYLKININLVSENSRKILLTTYDRHL